jgi:hypothetical protein
MGLPMPRNWDVRYRHGPPPEVIRVGEQAWVNVEDLRRLIGYRAKFARDNGYKNALTWIQAVLKDMLDGDADD